jgi:glycosyltransferase involved in cell wall biosynthesis
MAQTLRVLFYSDAPDFGGHELQTLAALRFMATQPELELGFIYFRGNARLAQHIADLAALHPHIQALPQDYASLRFQAFRTLVSARAIARIAAAMKAFRPQVVVAVQGAIAFCSAGLVAAKWAGIPVISYIPMTHPERFFSASRVKAALREPVNRLYYRLPDAYITISPRMETYLRHKGLRQPVSIVQAAVDGADYKVLDKTDSRSSLGLAANDFVVALVGRVQFWQKRQDLAVQALAVARRQIPHIKLLIVGDGPDLAALRELVRTAGLGDAVVFAGWTDGLSTVYSAMDALVIPSRYEGVPLVMLQALALGRPVIASAVDGMADTLPPDWLFPSGDASSLAARWLQLASNPDTAWLDAHRESVMQTHSLPVFERAFLEAVRLAVRSAMQSAASHS